MFYWVISAALLASALAEPCNLPGRWMLWCPPTMSFGNTFRGRIIPTQFTLPGPIVKRPVDDCDHSNSVVPPATFPMPTTEAPKVTETKNSDADFNQFLGSFMDGFSHFIANKNEVPTTTTTEAPKVTETKNSDADFNQFLGSFMDGFSHFIANKNKVSTTTTTKAPKVTETKNSDADFNQFLGSFMDGYSHFIANKNKVSTTTTTKAPKVTETKNSDADFNQFLGSFMDGYSHFIANQNKVPTTTTTEAPKVTETKFSNPKSETYKNGMIIETETLGGSSETFPTMPAPKGTLDASLFIKYFSENRQLMDQMYRYFANKNKYKVVDVETKQTVPGFGESTKITMTRNNPCDFATGIFRFIPCENLGKNEVIVKNSFPGTKSFETYSFNVPYGLHKTMVNTNHKTNNVVDC